MASARARFAFDRALALAPGDSFVEENVRNLGQHLDYREGLEWFKAARGRLQQLMSRVRSHNSV